MRPGWATANRSHCLGTTVVVIFRERSGEARPENQHGESSPDKRKTNRYRAAGGYGKDNDKRARDEYGDDGFACSDSGVQPVVGELAGY